MIKARIIIFLFVVANLFTGCQHELTFDTDNASEGILAKTSGGNCLPVTVIGNFVENVMLDQANEIEVSVVVERPGAYEIQSDEVNGYSFASGGTFTTTGTILVKLQGKGTPLKPGTNIFKITYNNSICEAAVSVADAKVPAATFDFAGAPTTCMDAIVSGAFVVGTELDTNSLVSLKIKVLSPGTYKVTTDTINGYHFEGSGTVTAPENQVIILHAAGKPAATGVNKFRVIFGDSHCSFEVTPLTPIVATGEEYFPLSRGSFWVYDYPGYTQDTLTRIAIGTQKIKNNDYALIKEKNPYTDETDLFFRKSETGYEEFGPLDKYTETIGYSPDTLGEIPILNLALQNWTSPLYKSRASFGQVIQLQYYYKVIQNDGTVVINGTAFQHVIKVQMSVAIAAENYGLGLTGETQLFYFARGIGLIYSSLSKSQGIVHEHKIRRWQVN